MTDLTGMDIGRYHLVERLGEGGMAVVYKAWDTRLERAVAVKFIRKDVIGAAYHEKMLKRFEREAKALARLSHPNIVKVYDFGEHEGEPYLVMEYLEGGTLKGRLAGGKRLGYKEAARLLLPVGRALAYAHDKNLIHRDVKPANILVSKTGEPTLSDFGIAKILDVKESHTLTGTGIWVGTPEYMAPEQWRNEVSVQTDVYALGVVFYELVTGRKPYVADTPAAIGIKQATKPLPHPRDYAPDLAEEAERVIFKALAMEARHRYASMGEFVQALEGLAAEKQADRAAVDENTAEIETAPQAGLANLPGYKKKERAAPAPRRGETRPAGWVWAAIGLLGVGLLAGIALVIAGALNPPPVPEPTGNAGETQAENPRAAQAQTQSAAGQATVDTAATVLALETHNAETEVAPAALETHNAETEVAPAALETHNAETEVAPAALETHNAETEVAPAAQQTAGANTGGAAGANAKDGAQTVLVPAGEFKMGSEDGSSDEKPLHTVYLDAYRIYKMEVSNAQYAKCLYSGKCTKPDCDYYGKDEYKDHPVVCVNWEQARAYCEWAGGRLPSEAEWEKAARGTDGRKYPWGEVEATCGLANYFGCKGGTTSVGRYATGASPYGALDMAGNAWEWVNDWYGEYDSADKKNPTGPVAGEFRGLRGGGWNNGSDYLRASGRYVSSPGYRRYFIGFRCAAAAGN